ncbi:PadR family transcriptional regulator [Deinococcus roseus]|uniref:PadR family transcriptional regulator n=1 Tax=Deinococcus roseus TaxID=392414 RepID=A0ABQ2D499_9DEIO|nr:PadR family transcriptional regulator [Deinococcus roseus]GGJ45533.1 PadR family transcriptional regulator [Deinococcus roseus]
MLSAQFHILFALLDGEKHGYAIMKAVQDDTRGRLKLGPATLYTNLKKMLAQGLIAETEKEEQDERRRHYRLSDQGRTQVEEQLKQMEATLLLAQQKRTMKS